MSFLEEVVENTKRIEARLEALGGSGDGLWEKAKSVAQPLNRHLLAHIRQIRMVRNPLLHEPGYRYTGDESRFLSICESVLVDLGAVPAKRQTNPNATQRANQIGVNRSTGGEMSNADGDDWVETLNEGIHGANIISTPSLRSVLYRRGGVVEVIPLGKTCFAGIKPFSSIQVVKQVKMDSRPVPVSFPRIETKDKVDVTVQLSIYFHVMNDERAIRRVADDAAGQQEQCANSVLPILQTIKDFVVEELLAQFIPYMFHRIASRGVGWQRQQAHVGRRLEGFAGMPTRPIEHHDDFVFRVARAPHRERFACTPY